MVRSITSSPPSALEMLRIWLPVSSPSNTAHSAPSVSAARDGFLQLAAAQHDAGLRGLALLGHLCHGFHVVCFAQGGKLCKAALAVPQALIQRQQNDLRRGVFLPKYRKVRSK